MNTTQRIPSAPREEWTDDHREVFAFWGEPNSWEEGSKTNIIMAMGNHPDLGKVFNQWGKHFLMNNSLNTRQLEIIILRVAWRVKSAYEWHNHVGYAVNAGITLDEIAAFMHRETGLDVISSHELPVFLPQSLGNSPTTRVAAEMREVTVPTEPPVSLLGGFEVSVSLDLTLKVLAFWSTSDCKHTTGKHCWSEVSEGPIGGPGQGSIIRKAAEALYSQRHLAAQFLLDTLQSDGKTSDQ